MLLALETGTLLLVAIAMALSLAHALEMPGKMRLDHDAYLAVQRIYYPGFTFGGIAEPLAAVALAALTIAKWSEPAAPAVLGGALIFMLLTHILYWALTAPINRVWLKGQDLTSGARRFFESGAKPLEEAHWTLLRIRWERSHVYRALTAMAAFVLTAIATAL